VAVFRFNLSLRELEEMLPARGIDVSYETIRRWVINFGPVIARNLRLSQDRPGDVWRLDEVIVKISGRKYWLWRAIDQHGVVLDEILQPKRDKRAAKRVARPDKASWFQSQADHQGQAAVVWCSPARGCAGPGSLVA